MRAVRRFGAERRRNFVFSGKEGRFGIRRRQCRMRSGKGTLFLPVEMPFPVPGRAEHDGGAGFTHEEMKMSPAGPAQKVFRSACLRDHAMKAKGNVGNIETTSLILFKGRWDADAYCVPVAGHGTRKKENAGACRKEEFVHRETAPVIGFEDMAQAYPFDILREEGDAL